MALPDVLAPGSKTRTAAAVVGSVPLAAATAIINPLAKAVSNINESIANNPVNKALDATGGALANAFNKISGRQAPRQEKDVATNIKDSTNILEQIRDLLEAQAVATGAYQKKDLELKEEQDREEDRRLRKIQKDDKEPGDNIIIENQTEKEGADPAIFSGFLKKGLSLLLGGGILYMFGGEIMKFLRTISLDEDEIASNINLPFILDKTQFPSLYDNPFTDDGLYNFRTSGPLDFTPFNFNLQETLAQNNLTYNRPDLTPGILGEDFKILDPSMYFNNFGTGLSEQYQEMLTENYFKPFDLSAYQYPIGDGTGTEFRIPQSELYGDISNMTSLYSGYNFGMYGLTPKGSATYFNPGFGFNNGGTNPINLDTKRFAAYDDAFKEGGDVRKQIDAERQNIEQNKKKTKFKNMGKLFLMVDGIMKGLQFLSAEATYEGQMKVLEELTDYYDEIQKDPEIKEAIEYLYPELLKFEDVIRETEEKIMEDYEIERGKIFASTIGAVGTGSVAKIAADILLPTNKAKYTVKFLKFVATGSAGLSGAQLAEMAYEDQMRVLHESRRETPHEFESTFDAFEQLNLYLEMIEEFRQKMANLPGVYDPISSAGFEKFYGFDRDAAEVDLDTMEIIPKGDAEIKIDGENSKIEINGNDVNDLTEEISAVKESAMLNNGNGGSSNQIVAPTTTTVVTKNDTSYNLGNDSTNILGTVKAVV